MCINMYLSLKKTKNKELKIVVDVPVAEASEVVEARQEE